MSYAELYINGSAQENLIETDQDVRVSLEFDQDDAYSHVCADCGESVDEDGTDESGENECSANSLGYEHDNDGYPDCGPGCQLDGSSGEDHYLRETFGAHSPERAPLSWVNSAAISIDPGEDQVTVTISVGDPRGAFAFTVRRVTPNEGEPYLVMHTPYPGETMAHMPMEHVSDGTYRVLPYGATAKPRQS